jgi:hypothetical protein
MSAQKLSTTSSRLNLNLLYPQGINPKIYIRFIKWLIAYGRFIVIIVEVVVLACFVYRFKLDEDLNHLKETINNQVPYLESLTTDESLNNQTQTKLKTIQQVYTSSENYQKVLTKIASQTPIGTKVSNINLDGATNEGLLNFKITSQTPNNNEVAIFLNGLKNTPNLSEITLASISFDQGILSFTITGKIKS